eukprot:1617898-Amphidinium_carterae.1
MRSAQAVLLEDVFRQELYLRLPSLGGGNAELDPRMKTRMAAQMAAIRVFVLAAILYAARRPGDASMDPLHALSRL